MFSNLIAVTAALASTAVAFDCSGHYFSFFNRDGSALSYQRLDPALFPGTESPHLHSFDGGSGLSATTDYEQTQSSKCSTARIKTDKSLYWRPTLFWNGNGTGFYRVPEKNTKIYYKYGDGSNWANVTGFPENFNMMAGFPAKRADGDNPAGVRWACHQPDGSNDKIFSNGFPKGFQSCSYGFASEVTFPSCWNGQKLDPKNPHAHMTYPTGQGVGTEKCPSTHRAARFPEIFIEFWYDISSFDGQYSRDSVPWVISNGDPTGFGFHADFLNGWEKGVLEKATGETDGCKCGCGCGQAEMEQCFGSNNVNKNNEADFEECSVNGIASEEAKPVLDALPGCNPLQSGPADATVVTGPNCAAATVAPPSDGDKSSAGTTKTPAATLPAKPSSTAEEVYSSKVVKEETDKPTPVVSLPNKQEATPTAAKPSENYGNAPSSGKEIVEPTPSASGKPEAPQENLPSLTLAPNKPTNTPSSGDEDEECPAPVYVTVTPTIYVTAGSNSTACGLGTVTKTLTETATVTMPAAGGIEYGSY